MGTSRDNRHSDNRDEATDQDWHPADVLAALKKRGASLAGLSVANGYHPTAAGKALRHPWPAIERLVAAAIGVAAQQIWPSRYGADGNPKARAPKGCAPRARAKE